MCPVGCPQDTVNNQAGPYSPVAHTPGFAPSATIIFSAEQCEPFYIRAQTALNTSDAFGNASGLLQPCGEPSQPTMWVSKNPSPLPPHATLPSDDPLSLFPAPFPQWLPDTLCGRYPHPRSR
jgi:hypothetical protein